MKKLKILVTCPPMLESIDFFDSQFNDLNFDVTTPKVIQTLSEEELLEIVPKHDGWIIGDDIVTNKILIKGKKGKLKAAVKWGIGIDNIDFKSAKKIGIPIVNTPNVFGAEVADLALCYLLGLSRSAFLIDRSVRNGKWIKPVGESLENKTLGIIGLGDIGSNIAKRAHAFDMNIIGWDPHANKIASYIEHKKSWPHGISECDFIIFACSLNQDTFHMFNDEVLDICKKGIKIINISRGQLIDELTIIRGLKEKHINSIAFDVFEKEPLQLDNEILKYEKNIFGSHNGSNTIEAVIRASNKALIELHRMLNEKN